MRIKISPCCHSRIGWERDHEQGSHPQIHCSRRKRPVTGAGENQHSARGQESPATAQHFADSDATHSAQDNDEPRLPERPHGHQAGYDQEAGLGAHGSSDGCRITSPAIAAWLNQGIKDDPYHTLQSDTDAPWVEWPAEPVPADGNTPDQWSVAAAAGDPDPEEGGRRRRLGARRRGGGRRDARRE
ncbi:hypothetical protein RB597_009464 [Gaeumannomyces tritici]